MAGRAAGVDIGGTKCLGVVLDGGGAVVAEHRVATPAGAAAVAAAVGDVAEVLRPWATLGVGAAGLVTTDGVVRAAPNLPGVVELALGALLAGRFGQDVAVDNDATCAMAAEWRVGAARGATDAVLVTLGTGIGAGVVSGGRLVRGANGFAGEPGHMVVDPGGPPCVCGRQGCWERFASGSGLARLARDAAEGGRLGSVVATVGGDPDRVRGEDVLAAARRGDPDAVTVVDRFSWWVALGLANVVNLLDPAVVVLGGGLVEAAEVFLGRVRVHLRDLLYSADHRPVPPVVPAALGERAGAIGAALLGAGRVRGPG